MLIFTIFIFRFLKYCLDHRAPKDHQCANSEIGAKKAIVCPMCSKTIKYEFGEDENEIVKNFYCFLTKINWKWAKHFSADCPEAVPKEKQVAKDKKCFLRTCNSKILPINTFVCQKCGYEFCLKHRYEDSHDCKNNLLAKREKAYINTTNVFNPPVNVENKVNSQYINHQSTNNNSSKVDFEKLEFCDVCGKSFHTIDELINHAEKTHIMVWGWKGQKNLCI